MSVGKELPDHEVVRAEIDGSMVGDTCVRRRMGCLAWNRGEYFLVNPIGDFLLAAETTPRFDELSTLPQL